MPFARRAEIQKAMVSIGPQTAMGPHIGWKAGGTNAAAQKTLGLSGPFREVCTLLCRGSPEPDGSRAQAGRCSSRD